MGSYKNELISKNPIHIFLPLQIHLGIVFTLKRRYFQIDSIQTIYIIISL